MVRSTATILRMPYKKDNGKEDWTGKIFYPEEARKLFDEGTSEQWMEIADTSMVQGDRVSLIATGKLCLQIQRLEGTIKELDQQNERLQKRFLALTVVGIVLAVVATVTTVIQLWIAVNPPNPPAPPIAPVESKRPLGEAVAS
jgi:hypothetical protein